MSIFIGVLIGLLVLMLLVVVHELGHFFMARRNGVEVEEFGIGFPPKAIAWQKKDGKWKRIPKDEWEKPTGKGLIISLNWLPIGGFCKMKDESDAATTKGSFGKATFWGKTKILFGGVVANWLFAIVILTILAWTGMPHFIENQFKIDSDVTMTANPVAVAEVKDDSPASEAGLMEGDVLLSLSLQDCLYGECDRVADYREVMVAMDVTEFNSAHASDLIAVTFLRDGEEIIGLTQLNSADDEYFLGVVMSQSGMPLYRSTWSAPIVGVATTAQLTGETFKGLGQLVWNLVSGVGKQLSTNSEVREEGAANISAAGDSVSGPVGIVGQLFPAIASTGVTNVVFLAAIISVSLACMNVLPIPALDGGRWILIVIYKLRKKKLTSEIEEKIVGRAFMVLIGLIVIITVLDITRFFG